MGNSSREGGGGPAEWIRYFSVATIGIEMVVALFIGMGMGWGLDYLLGTKPWFQVIFTGFGIAAGYRNLLRLAKDKRWAEDDRGRGGGDRGGGPGGHPGHRAQGLGAGGGDDRGEPPDA